MVSNSFLTHTSIKTLLGISMACLISPDGILEGLFESGEANSSSTVCNAILVHLGLIKVSQVGGTVNVPG